MKKESKNKEIRELEEKLAEATAGWQRTQADFINYKKRSAEEHLEFCKKANAELIYDLLPVLDNFQLAAKHIPQNLENDNWTQGIKQIEKQLESVLESEGLQRIKTVGEQFDPAIHEAVEHVSSDKPEDEITEEVLSGYKFDGQILRPAKVKVAKSR